MRVVESDTWSGAIDGFCSTESLGKQTTFVTGSNLLFMLAHQNTANIYYGDTTIRDTDLKYQNMANI